MKKTSGDPWDVGAIGNAEWTGVALRDVLAAAGPQESASFVGTTGADDVDVDGEIAPFGASISIAKALEPDVLLAWAMNGEPLAPEHGAPLRLVVPGYAGVRSAKWLTRIEVRDHPSDAPIQAKDYKLFPSSVSKDEADWDLGLTIEEMPLNAAICAPEDGAHVGSGSGTIEGYAVAFGRAVSRVEVSTNGGNDWVQADLITQTGRTLELDTVARCSGLVARPSRSGRTGRRLGRTDANRTTRSNLELRRLSLDSLASHHRHC